jgi:cytochrome c-type biogenesis protein CcmH/NrfF
MLLSLPPVVAADLGCPVCAEAETAMSKSRIAEALMNDMGAAEDICDNLTDVPIS